MNRAELINEVWWWRHPDKFPSPTGAKFFTYDEKTGRTLKTNDGASFFWKDGQEFAAHRYELVRRLHRDKNLPKWVNLHWAYTQEIWKAIGKSNSAVTWGSITILDTPTKRIDISDGLTMVCRFDLSKGNATLEKDFKAFIQRERERSGLFANKSRNGLKGTIQNKLSWRWLEVIDLDHFGIEKAKSSTASGMKSKALKVARAVEKIIFKALDDGEVFRKKWKEK